MIDSCSAAPPRRRRPSRVDPGRVVGSIRTPVRQRAGVRASGAIAGAPCGTATRRTAHGGAPRWARRSPTTDEPATSTRIEDTFEAGHRAARHRDQERPRPQGEPRRRLRADRPGRGVDHRAPHRPVGVRRRALQPRAEAGAQAAAPPPRDRRAPGQDEGQGPDARPARIYINDRGKAKLRARAGQGQADLGPAARDRRPRRQARHGAPGGRRPNGGARRRTDAARADAPGGRRPRRGRARAGDRRRRAGRPGRDDAREGAPPRDARRRAAQADAARAPRLPGAVRQRDPAADPSRGPGGLRDHGARRVPGHVGHEHDLRGHGAARDRDAADDRAGHGARARGAGRPDPGHGRPARGGKVTGVTFRNVPAFATHLDAPIEVPDLGTVTVDVAYGGMFYVIADAEALGFRLCPTRAATSPGSRS